ncbi:MAG TPA: hypothetical protein DCL21_02845 [Alphaproteobacteria bacterium]|nr:hypothetical protein [Alphaproteobacteria bacterium]
MDLLQKGEITYAQAFANASEKFRFDIRLLDQAYLIRKKPITHDKDRKKRQKTIDALLGNRGFFLRALAVLRP